MDFGKMQEMLSQASAMKAQLDERLAETVVEADAGGGAVVVKMNGKKRLLKRTLPPAAASAAAGDVTMLEDLIVAAVNAAVAKADTAQEASAAGMLGGLGLPGFGA